MKHLTLIPLLFLAACATQPKLLVRPAPLPAVEPVESVRYAEVVRAYYVGRTVAPDHPETMHEQHPIYRVEAAARWNLHPGPQTTANLLNPPPDAAFAPAPTNDFVIAEMNRQREFTARVMQEATRLTQAFDELQKVVNEMKTVAGNQVLMNARLAKTEQQVVEFTMELEKLTTAAQIATSDVPASVPETPDSPKP